ncbi:MAG TPA: toprim domain-containing protein, partial [Kamptonema sp.]|nr:toprim domain-containing protein [Kamptonema sp.]
SGGNGYYDRFRDRLMIPICDIQGRVIGFGGRTLTDEQPKYLNSPETELFDKGKTLYALDKAKTAISKQDRAVVVEGYFDAIALHAAGISNAVASLGTALSLHQVRQLLRYTESKQIVINFDADKAGTQAAERAIGEIEKLACRGEVQLRILNIPDGKDADDFLKNYSADKYIELLANAPLWLDWQIQNLLVNCDLKQADQYGKVTQEMVKLLSKITDDNQLAHYNYQCAQILSKGDAIKVKFLSETLLNQVVGNWANLLNQDESLALPPLVRNKLKGNKRFKKSRRPESENKSSDEAFSPRRERSILEQPEAFLLRIYIHSPEHRQAVIEAIEARGLQFSLSHHRFLWLQLLNLKMLDKTSLQADVSVLISKLQNNYLEFPTQLQQISHLFHLDETSEKHILRPPLAIRATIAYIEQITTQKRRVAALNMWKKTDVITQREKAAQYYQQFSAEQEWIEALDRLRRVNFSDLVSVPWIV